MSLQDGPDSNQIEKSLPFPSVGDPGGWMNPPRSDARSMCNTFDFWFSVRVLFQVLFPITRYVAEICAV